MRDTAISVLTLQFLRRRWLFMLFAGLIVIVLETVEHSRALGQIDLNFLPDVIGFGFVLPIIAGVILGQIERVLADSQQKSIEIERLRIARDLHDSVGQSLSYMHLKLEQLALNENLDASSRNELRNIRTVSDDALLQIRQTLVQLNQKSDTTDIATALYEHAQLLGLRSNFAVDFVTKGVPGTLSPDEQQQLLSIFREALVNIEKHAHASRISLRFEWGANAVKIALYDDGRGFISNERPPEGHFGLKYMHQRAADIGARLNVAATAGDGTYVTLVMPLQRAKVTANKKLSYNVAGTPSYDNNPAR